MQKKPGRWAWLGKTGLQGWMIVASYLFLTIVFVAMFWPAISDTSNSILTDGDYTVWDSGWIRTDDGSFVNPPVTLSAQPNVPVTIYRTLPQTLVENAGFCFISKEETVLVAINSTPIYTLDTADVRPYGKATISQWNFVPLPKNAGGQLLSITLTSPYPAYAGAVDTIRYGDLDYLRLSMTLLYLSDFIVCLLLMMLGLVMYVLAIILSRRSTEYASFRHMGLFTLYVAIYLRTECKLPMITFFDGFALMQLKFFSFSLMMLPLIRFIKGRIERRYHKPFNIVYGLFVINFFVQIVIQLLDIADFMPMVTITHVIIGAFMTTMMVMYMIGIVTHRIRFNLFEVTGLVALLLTASWEMTVYYQHDYANTGNYLRGGIIMLIVCLSLALLQDISRRISKRAEMEKQLQRNHARLLASQIQPHFVYNTLNSIRALIKLAPEEAYKMVYDFSKYLRANIDMLGSDQPIRFSQELEHVRAYTDIELVRFSDRLTVEWDMHPADFMLPPLTIQPLVENSIKHGVCKKEEGGTVWISNKETAEEHIIIVRDDGTGMDVDAMLKKVGSAGMKNVMERLRQFGATLTYDSTLGHGTTATVTIPKSSSIPYEATPTNDSTAT
ncbi:MAG: histidine kinase [Eubacteriales bacterium]|nr:histidine kinase [Eubacteriales bacterium]